MGSILTAALVVATIGLLCAVVLVIASKIFAVKEDVTYIKLRNCLPGANCGACGYPGCDAYAKALASDKGIKTNLCTPGSDETSRQLAAVLGVEPEDIVEKVAVIHCYGDCNNTSTKMDYVGIKTCEAAASLYGGDGKCSYGCIGLGDCLKVCTQNAICIENRIAHIDARRCIGCSVCVKACPRGLISLINDVDTVLVTCNNTEKGASVKDKCKNGCIGCKKCEKNCPTEAIKVIDNLAKIDYELCSGCGECAKNCPVGCILISDFKGLHKYV